jgi:hypothetical protein
MRAAWLKVGHVILAATVPHQRIYALLAWQEDNRA